mgnify:CR=1 FL=1
MARKGSEVEQEAGACGYVVRTWSPGDGATRYRFFEKRGLAKNQSYFGPANGLYTALGRKEALTFLRGCRRKR